MKKIFLISVLIVVSMASFALSFGADRVIEGNTVTINVDASGATGCIVRETIPASITITNAGGGTYNAANGFIKWINAGSSCPASFTYEATGNGVISGTMTSVGVEQAITGDSTFPGVVQDPCAGMVCQPSSATCADGTPVSCANTCSNGICTACIPDCTGHNVAPVQEPAALTLLKDRMSSILNAQAEQLNEFEYEANPLQRVSKIANALKAYFASS